MALVKNTLASELEVIFDSNKPAAAANAASQWARAYASFAAMAMSSASSLPVNAMANTGILTGAFTGAFNSQSTSGAASAISSGVMSFWQAIVWVGTTAAGATVSPGNFGLASTLQSIFEDLGEKSAGDKASEMADAFEAGAKAVMVSDIPFIQPAPPIVGPIS